MSLFNDQRRYAVFCDGDTAATNRHYLTCKLADQPMITVEVGSRYATLRWDCITTRTPKDDLVRTMFHTFQSRAKGGMGKAEFSGSAFTGSVSRLEPGAARALANDYFDILQIQ